jgi:hypothetical protein
LEGHDVTDKSIIDKLGKLEIEKEDYKRKWEDIKE